MHEVNSEKYRYNILSSVESKGKKKIKPTKLIHTENRLVAARGSELGVGEMGDRGQKVQTSTNK